MQGSAPNGRPIWHSEKDIFTILFILRMKQLCELLETKNSEMTGFIL